MKQARSIYIIAILCIGIANLLHAQLPCRRPSARQDLDINMVRTTLLNGGDMWWDRNSTPRYEVPKGLNRNAIYCGAIWLGAIDPGGNLRVAAQNYHQTGDDFWAGPLDSMGRPQCTTFDRIWKINRSEVDSYRNGGTPTKDIKEWPGINPGLRTPGLNALAPFHDANGDGLYSTASGDYPIFGGQGIAACDDALQGEQSLWWVINDVGDIHTETRGAALGVEIHITAYAFNRPNSPIDTATFYRFKIINKSQETLKQSYFGLWTDSDLGNPWDDYVGCDVTRGMSYTYNSDEDDGDGLPIGYSSLKPKRPPPAIGVDILRGPLADANDGIDNDRDGTIDESGGEYISLSGFLYYNNDVTVTGNPSRDTDFYSFLRCTWRDSLPMVYGGNAYPGSPGSTTTACSFMFPGNSDPTGISTGGVSGLPLWTEFTSGNTPGDRRMLDVCGSFTMAPGAIKTVHAAVVFGWGAPGTTVPTSIAALQRASDKVQQLFDKCFESLYTGLQNTRPVSNFKMVPNPASTQLSISSSESSGILSIYTIQGQLLESIKISGPTQLDVSKLPRGLVLYTYITSKGPQNSGKLLLK